jgi:alpha-amylase
MHVRIIPLVLLALLAACGSSAGSGSGATAVPATAAEAVPTAVPAAATPTLDDAAALMATLAANAPSPTSAADAPNVPTVAPTITLGPTAEPAPLAAGWWDGAVCYEVFVRSFYDSDGDGVGDLQGLTQKLDYINDGDPASRGDLGASCIWLMPVAEAFSYHGYDVTDYYAVEQDYGTADDLKQFVVAAHERGIKVVVDLVLNHTSVEHPWFKEALRDPESPYRDWYIWSEDNPGYVGPWGDTAWHKSPVRDEYYYGVFWQGMPDLNYRNPDVTAEAQKISAFWLNDLGVDGFRLDAIKHVVEAGREQENTRETHAWLREYQAGLRAIKPDVFTIGEIFGGRPGMLDPYYPDQMDTYFEFGVGEGIIDAARSGSARGYMDAVQRAYERLPFQRWAPFLTNHDQERVMTTLDGDPARMRLAAVALLTLPGLPFVYYGEEIGMAGAKPDERLRTPMQWSAEPGAGFSTGTPWEALQGDWAQVNVAAQEDDPASLLTLYRQLIHLHSARPALATGSFTPLSAEGHPSVAAFLRVAEGDAALVVINFGAEELSGVTLSAAASDLAPGSYQAEPLLGEEAGAVLTAGEGGTIEGYAPLPVLAPQTGYVFGLAP